MSNLKIFKSEKPNNILVIPVDNKKDLAYALENMKIRDYEGNLRAKNTNVVVLYLLNLLGVKASEDTRVHHMVCTKFINNNLKNYTYQEIELAFEKYVLGEFYDQKGNKLLVTQQLNAVVMGNVMACYSELKKNELDDYRRKRNEIIIKSREKKQDISEEEKKELVRKGVINCYDYYCEHDKIPTGYLYVYDVLYDLGYLEKDNEKKKSILSLAKSRVNREIMSRVPRNIAERNDLKALVKQAKENLLVSNYKSKAKEISMEIFFNDLKNSNKKLTDLI